VKAEESKQESPSLVSILVANWNRAKLLKDCLDSLFRQTHTNCEIIVVDNGSSDESVAVVREIFPAVKIIELGENRGFTGGNSAGLKRACGDFIALVNNDVITEGDWLEKLIWPMLVDPSVGICASKLIVDGRDVIDSAGNGFTTGGAGFNRGFGADRQRFSISESVFGACGAAVLYRREMLDEIGFFDDDFFLYDEDIDLSFRAQLAGWKCWYVAGAVAHHKGNATVGRLSDDHVYYHTRNLEFVWIKNMPLGLMIRFAPQKLLQEIGSFCYLCLRHRRGLVYYRAKRDALSLMLVMWRKRKTIQASKRASNSYIKNLMTPIFSRQIILNKVRQFIQG
jgi:GT2 family glycosyltransferase